MLVKISSVDNDSVAPLPVLLWSEMQQAIPIRSFEIKFYRTQVEQMVRTCMVENGIGLSANQVGINRAFFVMQVSEDIFGAFFSPTWKPALNSEIVVNKEGCLSAPGEVYMVERPNAIEASWWGLNAKNQPAFFAQKMTGLAARCFIHETEHSLLKTIADTGHLVIDPV